MNINVPDKVFDDYTNEYVKLALTDGYCCYLSFSNLHNKDDVLDISLVWDEGNDHPLTGKYLTMNIRKDLLEYFGDDPEHYAEKIKETAKAFRDLADELERL